MTERERERETGGRVNREKRERERDYEENAFPIVRKLIGFAFVYINPTQMLKEMAWYSMRFRWN